MGRGVPCHASSAGMCVRCGVDGGVGFSGAVWWGILNPPGGLCSGCDHFHQRFASCVQVHAQRNAAALPVCGACHRSQRGWPCATSRAQFRVRTCDQFRIWVCARPSRGGQDQGADILGQ